MLWPRVQPSIWSIWSQPRGDGSLGEIASVYALSTPSPAAIRPYTAEQVGDLETRIPSLTLATIHVMIACGINSQHEGKHDVKSKLHDFVVNNVLWCLVLNAYIHLLTNSLRNETYMSLFIIQYAFKV